MNRVASIAYLIISVISFTWSMFSDKPIIFKFGFCAVCFIMFVYSLINFKNQE